MAIGMNRDEKGFLLKGKPHTFARLRCAAGSSQAKRFALQLKKLLGIHFPTIAFNAFEHPTFGGRKRGDLALDPLRLMKGLPRCFER